MAIIQSIFLLKCYGSLVRVNTQKKSSFLNQAHVYISIINQSEDAQLSVSPRLNSAQNNSLLHVPNRDEIQFPYHALRQEGKQQQKKRSSKRSEIAIDISQNLKPKPQPEIPILTFECATHLFRLPKAKAVGEGKQQPSAYVQVQRIQRLFVLVINIQTSTRRKKGGIEKYCREATSKHTPTGSTNSSRERGGKCAAKEKG